MMVDGMNVWWTMFLDSFQQVLIWQWIGKRVRFILKQVFVKCLVYVKLFKLLMLSFSQQLHVSIILTQLWHFISIAFICGIFLGLAVVLFVILSRRQRFKSKINVSKPAHNYDTNLKIILNAFSQLSIIITFDALVLVLNYMDRSSIV